MKLKTLLLTLLLSLSLSSAASSNPYIIDINKARQAAEQGDAESQYQLGEFYDKYVWFYDDADSNSIEVRQWIDKVKNLSPSNQSAIAHKWYEKAAKQGHMLGQVRTGFSYDGWGALRSPVKKAYWLEKAAEQGHIRSQEVTGYAYLDGYGVTKNLSKAKFWLEKAHNSGNLDEYSIDFLKERWNDNELWKY